MTDDNQVQTDQSTEGIIDESQVGVKFGSVIYITEEPEFKITIKSVNSSGTALIEFSE